MNENDLKDTQTDKKYLTVLLPVDHPIVKSLEEHTFTWGSAQYEATAALYKHLCGKEATYGKIAVLTTFDILPGKVQRFEGDILECFKESLCVDVVDPEVVGDDTSEIRKEFEHISTVTEALHFFRSQAWDLWCAIPYIIPVVFPELKLGNVNPEHRISVECWLLKSYGFVEDDEPFKGWDT